MCVVCLCLSLKFVNSINHIQELRLEAVEHWVSAKLGKLGKHSGMERVIMILHGDTAERHETAHVLFRTGITALESIDENWSESV